MQKNKTIVITGCSSGFGLTLLDNLLKEGHRIFAICRNLETRLDLLKEQCTQYPDQLSLVSADLSSIEQLNSAIETIKSNTDSLDVLVNNAGYGLFGALEDLTPEQLSTQLQVNALAPALLTRGLLPLLRKSQGKIINVSSIMGQISYPLSAAYSASKFALEGLSEALYFELQPHNVNVTLVEPGGYRTNFTSNLQWGVNSFNLESPYYKQSQAFNTMMKKLTARKKAPNPAAVAILIQKLIHEKNPPLRVRSGTDAKSIYILKRSLPSRIFNGFTTKFFKRIRAQHELR